MTDRQQDSGLTAALKYAAVGWPVFPCIPGEKVPSTAHGFQDATTDAAQITRWWDANPGRNVAIATGAPGPDVLDVDQHGEHGNGFGAFNRLKRDDRVPEPLAVVRTPSGGMHLYYRGTGQRNGSIPRQHLDYRGTGGYVVAPPSRVSGRPYEVISHQPSPATFDWQATRDFLDPPQERPQRQAGAPTDLDRLVAHVERLRPGNRNGGLYWAALQAAKAGALDDEAAERFVQAALRAGIRGGGQHTAADGEREARKTVESARNGRRVDPTRQPQRELEAS
jgi:hypothetical protein